MEQELNSHRQRRGGDILTQDEARELIDYCRRQRLEVYPEVPTLSVAESAPGEISYSTVPRSINGRTWYRTAFKNPHPEKSVSSFEYISDNGEPVEIMSVSFSNFK